MYLLLSNKDAINDLGCGRSLVGGKRFWWFDNKASKKWKVKERDKKKEIRFRGATRVILFSHSWSQAVSVLSLSNSHRAWHEIDELVVHLERNLDLSTMEQGIRLVGTVLVNKTLNKWGTRNILRSAWKELGKIDIKWVKDNTFIITVSDESTTMKILEQVP